MGVMPCNRNSCENILCDTYVDSIGYICNDCQSEFKEYLDHKDMEPETEGEIRRVLIDFMNTTKKGEYDDNEISVTDFFKKYSR